MRTERELLRFERLIKGNSTKPKNCEMEIKLPKPKIGRRILTAREVLKGYSR